MWLWISRSFRCSLFSDKYYLHRYVCDRLCWCDAVFGAMHTNAWLSRNDSVYRYDNGIARTYTIIAHCIVNEDKGKLAIWKICRIQRNTDIVLAALHEPIVLQKHTEKQNWRGWTINIWDTMLCGDAIEMVRGQKPTAARIAFYMESFC